VVADVNLDGKLPRKAKHPATPTKFASFSNVYRLETTLSALQTLCWEFAKCYEMGLLPF